MAEKSKKWRGELKELKTWIEVTGITLALIVTCATVYQGYAAKRALRQTRKSNQITRESNALTLRQIKRAEADADEDGTRQERMLTAAEGVAREMGESNKSLRAELEIERKNSNLAEASARARRAKLEMVGPIEANIPPIKATLSLKMFFYNAGQIPAGKVDPNGVAAFYVGNLPSSPEYRALPLPGISDLSPGGRDFVLIEANVNSNQVVAAESGAVSLFYYGTIKYEDAFGLRTLYWCQRWSKDMSAWMLCGEHNRTEDK